MASPTNRDSDGIIWHLPFPAPIRALAELHAAENTRNRSVTSYYAAKRLKDL